MATPAYADLLFYLPGNRPAGLASFVDRSSSEAPVTVFGNVTHSAAQSRQYTTSIYLDGSGDYLRSDAVSTLVAGLPNVTFAGWFYHQSIIAGQNTLFGFHGAGTSAINRLVYTRTAMFSTAMGGFSYTGQAAGAWYHFAAVLTPTENRVYINGTLAASAAIAGNSIVAGDRFSIGQEFDGATASDFLHGYVQDFFVCSGELYTADFTPPGPLIGDISGTVLDADGLPAVRRLVAVPRVGALTGARDTVSAVDGTYTIADLVNGVEHAVVALDDDAGATLPDLVQRAVAE